MSKIEKLNELHEEFKKELAVQEDVERELVQYLNDIKKEHEDIIEWFHEKSYHFKHPILLVKSAPGPVLHATEKHLYYWSRNRGVIKGSMDGAEEEQSNLYEVVRNSGFTNAVQGLMYIDKGLEDYVHEMRDNNLHMKKQLQTLIDYT